MSSIFDIVKEDLMDYTFLISMIILLAIPLFNIILYKEKEDYGGYDERQEIVRGKAFKYGRKNRSFLFEALITYSCMTL